MVVSVRIGLIIMGVVLIVLSFCTHCAKRLLVDYAVAWSLFGVCLVFMGAIPVLSDWINHLGVAAAWELFGVGVVMLCAGTHESMMLSQVVMKNKELAMQIALLNQENEAMKIELKDLTEALGEADAEKDYIYH